MDINNVLTEAVHTVICRELDRAKRGHCLRVTTLSEQVMKDICMRLNTDGTQADVVLLVGPRQLAEYPWQVTATHLIELRNAEEKPLLVFIPPAVKAAAEDSFDISTFVEIKLGDVPRTLSQELRAKLPDTLQSLTDRVIRYLQRVERRITTDDIVRYYLTILNNGSTSEAAGSALYHFKLVPDFDLLMVSDRIEQRLDRNVSAIGTLNDSSQPLLGRVHELRLQPNTLQTDLYNFLESQTFSAVSDWGAEIATNPAHRNIAFDRWQFESEELNRDKVLLTLDPLNLPTRDNDQPTGADNPLYVDLRRANSVLLRWTTDPKPAVVPYLAYFRVEIISADGAVVWTSKNIANSASRTAQRSKGIKVADFRDLIEDGLYYFRVRAYSEVGEIVNEEDPVKSPEILRDPTNEDGKRKNESDDVWFWVDETAPPPAEPQRNVVVASFLEAQLHVLLTAIARGENPIVDWPQPRVDKTGWATSKGKRTEAIYNVVYDAQARFTISVSNLLRRIETETLANPHNLGRWRLNFASGENHQSVSVSARQYRDSAEIPQAFLAARTALFQAIQAGARESITAAVDLTEHADLILNYVEAYNNWLAEAQARFETLAIREDGERGRTDSVFLDLDTAEVILPKDSATPSRVYLLAPTHPLRILWHLQRARMCHSWIRTAIANDQTKELLSPLVRQYMESGLAPVNLPPVLRTSYASPDEGLPHFYVEQAPLTPFWSLYVREDVRDSRVLRARVQGAMGVGRQSGELGINSGVAKELLADKLLRYLVQHPYVDTIKINVFNPGDAGLVVDAILVVEKALSKRQLPLLRYEIRLFTRSARLDYVGEALEELVNPERQVSPEADAFSVASANHLFPKLRFSRNRVDEFLQHPEAYEAHISILHDVFPVDVETAAQYAGRSSFVYGLLQEQVIEFAGDSSYFAWQRQLVPAPCKELPGDAHDTSALLASLLEQIGHLQASVAAGKQVEDFVPTIRLILGLADKNLLYQVHAVSDWVIIIDKHLGLDYFDSDAGDARPIYLMDFSPEFGSADTDRLLLTTRSVDDVVRLIHPVLREYNLLIGTGTETYCLQLLRSLSGRLALKLLSAPSNVSEALGLATARLFLEQFGLLTDRIVLPLDAHGTLFSDAAKESPSVDDVSLQRGDLLLVECDPESRQLLFHIIEVKWRKSLGDFNAYIALRQQIESQLLHTERALRQHFDPHYQTLDRLDRQVKTRELIALLDFYLERSHRYRLIGDDALAGLRKFIATLDDGYSISVAGAGLVFDSAYSGLAEDEEHAGLIFHRVGGDYIHRLWENGVNRYDLLGKEDAKRISTIEDADKQRDEREDILRITSMSGDSTYERVRTSFGGSRVASKDRSEAEPTREQRIPPKSETSDDPIAAEEEANSVVRTRTADSKRPEEVSETAPPQTGEGTATLGGSAARASHYDVLLGESNKSRQFGILGKAGDRVVALDLNGTNTISLFGVQGSGKSYTVGTVVEMATVPAPGINLLPSPLASVIFHYHESQDYPPEFVSMANANTNESEVEVLERQYGARPTGLEDVIILTSADKLDNRRREFPSVRVEPIYFGSSELSIKDWRFLMGVVGNQMYVKQMNLVMRQLRQDLTLESLQRGIENSALSDSQKNLARVRLTFATQFINDGCRLSDFLRPGRLIIVDLRDEFIDKDEALGLFVVMLNIFANASQEQRFNRLIVFDEAHKYMGNEDLTDHIVEVIRQMRHQGVSVVIASQDPLSIPNAIIELSSVVILHKFNSPKWLAHIQRSITALAGLAPAQLAALRPGEAYVWSTRASEPMFTQRPVKVLLRPRITQHGGGTRTATASR